jgi:hypothetical protein
MAAVAVTMTMSATPAAEELAQSTDFICGPLHDLADSTVAVVCRLMRRVWASVSVSVSSIRLLWRCRGAVVWVSAADGYIYKLVYKYPSGWIYDVLGNPLDHHQATNTVRWDLAPIELGNLSCPSCMLHYS